MPLDIKKVALKVDVDTEHGTRIGVPNLQRLFDQRGIGATFLFSMGRDNTGRAIRRVFRPGFFQKISRTSIVSVYGIRTLLNGLLFPGPHIGKRHGALMRGVAASGHEVGVHCYDHVAWQDKLAHWSEARTRQEVNKAVETFKDTFGHRPFTMGSAGWQANKASLSAYEEHSLLYASDTRGTNAFFPTMKQRHFSTLQIPTTLPTLDELIGRPEYPFDNLIAHYHQCIEQQSLNVLTIHAELEGMAFLNWFEQFIDASIAKGIHFIPMITLAHELMEHKKEIPQLELIQGMVDGRSGTLAMHKP